MLIRRLIVFPGKPHIFFFIKILWGETKCIYIWTIVKIIYTQQFFKNINSFRHHKEAPIDMNLLKWAIPWSHIVGEVISCTTRKRNRSIIHNYEPDFSSLSTDWLSKKLVLMLPEGCFLEDSCLDEIWLVYQCFWMRIQL